MRKTANPYALTKLPGKQRKDDARVKAIAEAAKALVAQHDAWLNPAGASGLS